MQSHAQWMHHAARLAAVRPPATTPPVAGCVPSLAWLSLTAPDCAPSLRFDAGLLRLGRKDEAFRENPRPTCSAAGTLYFCPVTFLLRFAAVYAGHILRPVAISFRACHAARFSSPGAAGAQRTSPFSSGALRLF